MSVESNKRHALLSWVFVVVLVVLCATLGAIQYVWIGQVSRAEHDRLQGSLQSNLQRVSEDFNAELRAVSSIFSLDSSSTDEMERESELANRLARWRTSSRHAGLIRRVAVVVPEKGSLTLRNLDLEAGTLAEAEWPATWTALRDRLTARVQGLSSRQEFAADGPILIDLPQFDRGQFGRPQRESAWTIVELDPDYLRANLIPELLLRHLGEGDKLNYHVEVVARNSPATVIFDSDPTNHSRATLHADASVGLFETGFIGFPRMGLERGRFGGGRGPGTRPPPRRGTFFEGRGPAPPGGPDRGRWLLAVQHRAGSLEALVEQSRRRNLAITGGILLLTLAAVGALIQFSRRSQQLAELQMEFVASVSHELRTPLAVIRTASHNLGARLVSNPNQVQRYGALIEEQSEKLTDIMDRVLLFSNAKAGRVIHAREVIGVDQLIDEALGGCEKILQESGCTVERNVEPGTPAIFGDPTALKHALLNLISNAAKYGAAGGWVGISAAPAADTKPAMIEIRVADRGPGIPASEQGHIFDAFYRGKVAVADQIHGTGLGLSLVKRIVQAHGGTVVVRSEPGKLTELVMNIPAAPAEKINEFADPVNRG